MDIAREVTRTGKRARYRIYGTRVILFYCSGRLIELSYFASVTTRLLKNHARRGFIFNVSHAFFPIRLFDSNRKLSTIRERGRHSEERQTRETFVTIVRNSLLFLYAFRGRLDKNSTLKFSTRRPNETRVTSMFVSGLVT